ncbi:MAG: hypothetical protein IJY84_05545 [Clostridia bacterium]|nr:hypothetical protein [Clostridia bacterium]
MTNKVYPIRQPLTSASQIGFLLANRKMRLARLYSRLLLFPKILLQSKIIFGIDIKARRRGLLILSN